MLGENLEEVENEDKNIENFIITKTQLRKAIKKDGLAYVLLVQKYNPDKDAVLADNQEHMSRGKLFPSFLVFRTWFPMVLLIQPP